jgi:hypothetical protein
MYRVLWICIFLLQNVFAMDSADFIMGLFNITPTPMRYSAPPDPYPYPATRTIEDKKYEIVDTDLKYGPGIGGSSPGCSVGTGDFKWINNNLFIIDAFKNPQERRENDSAKKGVLVDARTGTYQVLVEPGYALCMNGDKKILDLAKQSPHQKVEKEWQIKFDMNGSYTVVPSESEIKITCWPESEYPLPEEIIQTSVLRKNQLSYKSLNAPDGHIVYSKDVSKQQASALLIAPQKAPVHLPITNWKMNFRKIHYLKYLDKYYLCVSPHIQPEEKFPTHYLMAHDGTVEPFPYPKILFDYGLKREYREFIPTSNGIFINATSREGLLLLKGEKLYRIYGGNKFFAKGRGESVRSWAVSPDGCKVVFTHYKGVSVDTDIGISIESSEQTS